MKVHDVAFALEPEPYASPESAFFEGDDIIGINVSGLILKWYANDARAFQREIAAFIEMLLGKGYRVALIPHVSKPGGPLALNDHAFLREIRVQISAGEDRVLLLPDGIPTRQLKWAISRCRIFFGARTHATIAAISTGVPTIAIAYSAKARGIWNDVFENTDYLLDTDKVAAHTLTEKFELVLSGREGDPGETFQQAGSDAAGRAEKNALRSASFLAFVIERLDRRTQSMAESAEPVELSLPSSSRRSTAGGAPADVEAMCAVDCSGLDVTYGGG